ncbi:MAG: trypsin-like serine protease [Planctomycetota bacterium]
MNSWALAIVVSTICAPLAGAVVVRRDVTESEVASRASAAWTNAVGALYYDVTWPQQTVDDWESVFGPWPFSSEDRMGGSGTLIAPHVVLTAAHLFDQESFAIDDGSAYWRFLTPDGTDIVPPVEVSHWVEHPGFGDVFNGQENAGYDLALVFLKNEVEGIDPIEIYRQSNERGRTGQIVGYGEYVRDDGTVAYGGEGTTPTKRRGDNRIDMVDPHLSPFGVWQGFHPNVMLADYDDPELYAAGIKNNDPEAAWPINPLGSTAPTNYEAMLGSGDSGGGLFTWNPEAFEFQIMGVNSFIMNFSDPFGFNYYDYHEISGFARVSTVADWIDATIAANPIPSPGGLLLPLVGAWCVSRSRRRAGSRPSLGHPDS